MFDCSTERVSKRNQNRSRNKTRMASQFSVDLWLENRVGKQCKERSNWNGQGHANEMLVRSASQAVEALGKGKG